jgi:hypothetical protein
MAGVEEYSAITASVRLDLSKLQKDSTDAQANMKSFAQSAGAQMETVAKSGDTAAKGIEKVGSAAAKSGKQITAFGKVGDNAM